MFNLKQSMVSDKMLCFKIVNNWDAADKCFVLLFFLNEVLFYSYMKNARKMLCIKNNINICH